MATLSVIVPALNEEGNIADTLDEIVASVEGLFEDYEIIVVNDGSTDRTGEILEERSASNPRIRTLAHPAPRGFGASYDAGRKLAHMEYCVMVHGDNAFGRQTLRTLFSHVGQRDIVCTYIVNPNSRSKARQMISALYTLVLNALFGLRLRYYNGLQVHRNRWLQGVALHSTGFSFQAELLIRGIRDRRTYVEIPAVHRERPGGGSTKIFKVRNLISVARTVFALYRAELFGEGKADGLIQ